LALAAGLGSWEGGTAVRRAGGLSWSSGAPRRPASGLAAGWPVSDWPPSLSWRGGTVHRAVVAALRERRGRGRAMEGQRKSRADSRADRPGHRAEWQRQRCASRQ